MFRKTRSLIAAVLVVIVQIVPGPMGLRPAHAFAVPLAAVAVGAVIAATGVMVAGAGVYKPPTFAQANAAVNSVTGDITRKVVVARAFADGVSSGMRGYAGQYILDFSKAADWIEAHTPDFPSLAPAISTATTSGSLTPAVGQIYAFSGLKYLITGIDWSDRMEQGSTNSAATGVDFGYPYSLGGGRWRDNSGTRIISDIVFNRLDGSVYRYMTTVTQYTSVATSEPITPIPAGVRNPAVFASAYPNTVGGQDETDKIAAENPAAIKSEPVPFTPEQIQEAMKQAEREMLDSAADTAETLAAADPTNTALQIAAQQARAAADQATIQAEAAKAEVETKPEDVAPPVPAAPLAPAVPLVPEVAPLEFLPPIKEAMDGLSASLATHEPFASFSTIPTLLGALTAPPVAPVIDIEFFGTHHLDFSPWNGAATMLRAGLSLFALIGATIFAIKIWV